jgi:hypothetical protein
MGDRTWVNVLFAKRDLEKFNKVLADEIYDGKWWDEIEDWDDDGKGILARIYEGNYGWYSQSENLGKAGLNFILEHGDGGSYGPGSDVAFNGEAVESVVFSHDSLPVVEVGPDLQIPEAQMETIKKYYELCEKVKAYIRKGS